MLFMYRNISTHAIVIRRERYGEFHKSLALLTADMGLINATAYGAYKMHSSLRLGSEPFTWSRVQLYHDPVRKSYKVTDLDIHASFEGLQRDFSKIAAASLWAEVARKSYGAGEVSGRLFRLFLESLQALDAAEARQEPYVTAQFLWRFLDLAGYQPATDHCDRCGAPLRGATPGGAMAGGMHPAAHHAPSNALLCTACGTSSDLAVPPGVLRYLDATAALPLAQALDVSLEAESLRVMRDLLPRMVQSVMEGELASLRWVGAGR
jgi:DNA repair protein RecO (recombination protein O)